ncbi:MAG: hypothetical protein JF887_09240 [Candidatus Dormibacteraeota bacterium]|uniref:Uncharacterized protein n=1 Tax=Candidatus Amunia macphersoniae TaxID=3127014 RepID=A0A934NJK6_9BACT|nr:hypothetical protein [Candidatus Dormibacteraeota bacterium]
MAQSGGVVKTIPDKSGDFEVRIVRNADGTFGFEEWEFSHHPLEQVWIPTRTRFRTVTDSAESAEREARGRVDWMIGEALDASGHID